MNNCGGKSIEERGTDRIIIRDLNCFGSSLWWAPPVTWIVFKVAPTASAHANSSQDAMYTQPMISPCSLRFPRSCNSSFNPRITSFVYLIPTTWETMLLAIAHKRGQLLDCGLWEQYLTCASSVVQILVTFVSPGSEMVWVKHTLKIWTKLKNYHVDWNHVCRTVNGEGVEWTPDCTSKTCWYFPSLVRRLEEAEGNCYDFCACHQGLQSASNFKPALQSQFPNM